MSINDLLIIAAGVIVGGGLLYLLLFLWRNVLYELKHTKDTKFEVDVEEFIPAAKELSYATGNIFKLRKYRTGKYKKQEKDKNLLDANLTKIVYGE